MLTHLPQGLRSCVSHMYKRAQASAPPQSTSTCSAFAAWCEFQHRNCGRVRLCRQKGDYDNDERLHVAGWIKEALSIAQRCSSTLVEGSCVVCGDGCGSRDLPETEASRAVLRSTTGAPSTTTWLRGMLSSSCLQWNRVFTIERV